MRTGLLILILYYYQYHGIKDILFLEASGQKYLFIRLY